MADNIMLISTIVGVIFGVVLGKLIFQLKYIEHACEAHILIFFKVLI